MKITKYHFWLAVILFFSFLLRITNFNWDSSYSFQPDERMIGFVVEKLNWDLQNFFSSNSKMNPEFFAYGSFPIYLLWIVKGSFVFFFAQWLMFDEILNLGRVISAFFDTLSVLIIFVLVKQIANKNGNRIAFFSAGIYAIMVLPIQLSHYYAVDTLLNLGFWTGLFLTIYYGRKRSKFRLALLAGVIGMTVATKITGIIIVLPITIHLMLIHKTRLVNGFKEIISLLIISGVVFAVLMPYAFVDWENFYIQIKEQSKLFYDAYAFPYTLQYVGTFPYVYFLKNIFFWGSGLAVSILSVLGIFIFFIGKFKTKSKINLCTTLIISTVLIYFLYMGYSEVKFNRYMLPIYPAIAIAAGYAVNSATLRLENGTKKVVILVIFGALLVYPLAFISTYFQTDTRSQASEWINNNIIPGSTIAIEHWDDRVPIDNKNIYNFVELKIYDQPDDEAKWSEINQQLSRSDYIVIASNRLYRPVQKLNNCDLYRVCYPVASKYYQNLFNGNANFEKIAEFKNEIRIPFTNIIFDDRNADESFTVYERPDVFIFKKIFK